MKDALQLPGAEWPCYFQVGIVNAQGLYPLVLGPRPVGKEVVTVQIHHDEHVYSQEGKMHGHYRCIRARSTRLSGLSSAQQVHVFTSADILRLMK